MHNTRISLKLGAFLTSLVLTACGGGTGDGSEISTGGKGGSGGSGGHAGSLVLGDMGGGGAGGAGGTSSAGAGGAHAGSGGSAGSVAGGGQAGSGSEACTPASPEGIPLSGSCAYATHCTDQYDTTFGSATLQQICEGQSGTWSTAPCVTTSWDIKCTQEVFGGVYIQYMHAGDICADGCEEPL